MYISKDIKFILDTLNNKNHKAYLVGGCVRDSIMGNKPYDFDITTSALPTEIKKIFSHTVDTGIKHGTVTVLLGKNSYEVTTYRIDGEYKDNRHPSKVTYTTDLKEDMSRRDFTINAIAYHYEDGFVDLFGGIDDIKNKVIRGVGEPNKRFQEDALRMIRALRFKAQLDFEIENNTMTALRENIHLIQNISTERVRDEIIKLLMTPNPEHIYTLVETKMLIHIDEYFYLYIVNNYEKIKFPLKNAKKDILLIWSILFWFADEKLINLLKKLHFDNKTIKYICTIIKFQKIDIQDDFYFIRKVLSEVDYFVFEYICDIKNMFGVDTSNIKIKMNKIKEENNCIKITDLDINGNDLKIIGILSGVEIGKVLKYLLECVLKEPYLNQKNYLIDLIKNNLNYVK